MRHTIRRHISWIGLLIGVGLALVTPGYYALAIVGAAWVIVQIARFRR